MNNKILIALFFICFCYLAVKNNAEAQILTLNPPETDIYTNFLYNPEYDYHTSISQHFIDSTFFNDFAYFLNKDISKIAFGRFQTQNLISVSKNKHQLSIDPIIHTMAVYSKDDNFNFEYGAGVNAEYNFNNKLIAEANLAYYSFYIPSYLTSSFDSIDFIPHLGTHLSNEKNKADLFYFNGFVNWRPADFLNIELGQGKNFYGDGYRSLFLSDNANYYPYLKLTTKFWKIKYQVLYSLLKDINPMDNGKISKKYSTMHILSWNISKKINVNLFETVIYSSKDSIGERGPDVNYLNPVIFFRPIEFSLGSPDNVLVGFGFKYNPFKNYHLYGQFIIDEFHLKYIRKREQYWANKFGVQVGVKAFNILNIKNLYVQIEYNVVRPYTYSHQDPFICYGNGIEPLAHPLGANFDEFLFLMQYQKGRWLFSSKSIYCSFGTDSDNYSVGQNIYRSYVDRKQDFDNKLKQGRLNNLFYQSVKLSYLFNLKMNLRFEAECMYRKHKAGYETFNDLFFKIGFRTMLFNDYMIFGY